METDSYAAMDILDSIPRSTLSRADSARFALLYTQAQIKNWIEVDSDTLIDRAYNYYKDRDQGTLTIRAYFYKAKVAYNRGDMRASMRDVLPAYEMAKEQNNPYWIAKTAELMADIFSNVYNYPQAEGYRNEVIENYRKAGRKSNERYAIIDHAIEYMCLNKNHRAYAILDSLKNICEQENETDSTYLNYLIPVYYKSLIITNQYNKIPDSWTNETRNVQTIDDALDLSEIMQHETKFDRSENLLNNAMLLAKNYEDTAHIVYEKYLNAKNALRYKEALSLSDSLLNMQSKIATDILFQLVNQEKSDFYSTQSDREHKKSDRLKFTLITGLSLFAFIVIILIFFYRLRINAKKVELESIVTTLAIERQKVLQYENQNNIIMTQLEKESYKNSELEEKLKNSQINDSDKNFIIQSLFKNQWKTLNLLCDEYFEKAGNENTRHVLLNNLEKELLKLRSERNLQLMEEEVNLYLDNIMTKLRSQCPNLQSDDYTFLMLNFAGLSLRAICFFTGIKYKTFHNKKMRLIRRIEASDAQDKAIFLKQLGVSV